jgi:hypothetical protein
MPGLISLLVFILIVCLVAGLVMYLIDLMPIDARLKSVARIVVIIIVILLILMRALPLITVSGTF